jgi:hypothetical protein
MVTARNYRRSPPASGLPSSMDVAWDFQEAATPSGRPRKPNGSASTGASDASPLSVAPNSPFDAVEKLTSTAKVDRQLELERASQLTFSVASVLTTGSGEMDRSRQRDIEVKTISKEMEMQSKSRSKVIDLSRGAAFKESLEFARSWAPALIEEIKHLAPRSRLPNILSVLDAQKLAVITIDRMLGLLLTGPTGMSQRRIIEAIRDHIQAEWKYAQISASFALIFLQGHPHQAPESLGPEAI